jgi:hypothetical protein
VRSSEWTEEGAKGDSGATIFRRLFTRRVTGPTALGRLRVTNKGGVTERCRSPVGERSRRRRGAGTQDSGVSREDEVDRGEVKGEMDCLGVALGGVDVQPR